MSHYGASAAPSSDAVIVAAHRLDCLLGPGASASSPSRKLSVVGPLHFPDLLPAEESIPQQFQPVRVRLARQQFPGALVYPVGMLAPQEPPVIEEELQQLQVVCSQVPPQRDVVPQPAVQVLHHTTGAHQLPP